MQKNKDSHYNNINFSVQASCWNRLMNSVNEDPRVVTARSELQRLEQCWFEYLHGGQFRFCSPSGVSVRIRVTQQLFIEYGVQLQRLRREQMEMSQLAQDYQNPLYFRRLIFPGEQRYNTFQGQAMRLSYEIQVFTILRVLCMRMVDILRNVMFILPGTQNLD